MREFKKTLLEFDKSFNVIVKEFIFSEAATGDVCKKSCFQKICSIHRKASVLESLYFSVNLKAKNLQLYKKWTSSPIVLQDGLKIYVDLL